MAFQKRTGVGDERKAGRVRLGKSVKRKGGNGLNDAVLRFTGDSLRFHAPSQFDFDFFHPRFGAFESERAAKFLGFATRESSRDHGDA